MKRFIPMIDKLVRYCLVGSLNTLVCISLIYLGASLGLHYSTYTAIGYIGSLLLSFFMNMFYTFRVREHIVKRMILFFSINLLNLALVEAIQYHLIENHSTTRLFAIACGMVWYTVTGFFLNNYYVYRRIPVRRDG